MRDRNARVQVVALLMILQEARYGHGEQPPVLVRHMECVGPPLQYLLTGRQVRFCCTKDDVSTTQAIPQTEIANVYPMPEYAA